MMLKVNGQYLDFNGTIEIDKKIKLFEDIETTDGDVSFAFDLELTSHNIKSLGIPFPDSRSKRVYNIQDTEVFNDEGLRINKGSIRVESISGRFASCSFFGGNSNWFAAISGNLADLGLSVYDRPLDYLEIIDSWSDTEGIVYPIIDTGTLITRGEPYLVVEDFVGCMFVHTLMKEVFKNSDIKIQGELINDPFYKSLVVVSNSRSIDDVNNRKSYVEKTTPQSVENLADPPGLVTFQNDSVLPFFDGSEDNYDVSISRYTADVKMSIKVSFTMSVSMSATVGPAVIGFYVYKNGVSVFARPFADVDTISMEYILTIDAGDYVEIFAKEGTGLTTATIESGTITFTPIFIYNTTGNSAIPQWTKQQFVSNIFRLFNCISSYDSISKTLTINYFDKIKEKEAIDLSEYLQVDTIDYSEFIGNYARQNLFSYQEGSDEQLSEYNISEFVKYGSGIVEADNDFIEQSAEVVESDFTSPISYKNTTLDGSLERINYVEYEEGDEGEITSVTDDSGIARFNITDADQIFAPDDVVRIVSDVPSYNGDFVVAIVTSTYVRMTTLAFDVDGTGTITKLEHKLTTDDNVYIMSVTKLTPTADMFGSGRVIVNGVYQSNAMLAFFNILRLGKNFEVNYKQGLSFGGVNSQFQYQKTLLDSFWRQFDRIVNDPVMSKTIGHLPWKVYNSLDFLRPVSVKTIETSNQYYINRITGYQNSYTPCEVELIKLP